MERGILAAREVNGVTHESAKTDLDGSIVALEILREVEEKYGKTRKVSIWFDSRKVAGICKGDKVKKLPPRPCDCNVHMRV